MKTKFLMLLCFLFIGFLGQAQKNLYNQGLEYFKAKNYEKAAKFFYADKFGYANKDLLIRRVISNYYLGNFDDAKQDVSTLFAFDVVPDETYLYTGKIFHQEGNYKKAIENYKKYLRKLSSNSPKRAEIIHTIKQCGVAIRLKYKEPVAFVDNYGPDINSPSDEFRMIQSPNFDSKYYFSSAREGSTGGKRDDKGIKNEEFGSYNSDMYYIEMVGGKWMKAEKLNPFINSSRDEMALDFSSDGSILFYVKGPDYDRGSIYTDTFSTNKVQRINPPKLDVPISAEKGDVYLNLFNDSTLIFSSNRAGGYGGQDLYVTAKRYGQWSKPKNLGPNINTRFDEISPYLTKDGNTVFYSSNRVESLGGYDVFYAEFDVEQSTWNKSENMGIPVNSAGDDLGFYVSRDGFTASMSSDRKIGAYGGFDLYVVYFKNQLTGQNLRNQDLAFLANEDFQPAPSYASTENKSTNNSKASKPSKLKKKKKKKKWKKNSKKPVVDAKPEPKPSPEIEAPVESKAKEIVVEPKKEVAKVEKEPTKEITPAKVKKEKKQEYVINPIFYTPDGDILSPANKRELDLIVDVMSIYPSLELELKAHTREEGLEAYDLYFTIKRAEKLAEYLISKSIDPSRISMKGYGSNYPIAKTETGGKKSKIAEKVNSRIEFQINKSENLPIVINMVEPYLVDYLRDPKGELFKTVEDGLSYRVQIASVKQMYQNQVLLLYTDSMIEKDGTKDLYKYTLGLYESYKDSKSLLKDLSNYNITGAFIVPYINGQRIPKEKVIEYAKYYPDLMNYMQYNDE